MGSRRLSEDRRVALGLLSVELLSSVDNEFALPMLDLALPLSALLKSPSWLWVLSKVQDLGRDLLKRGELKGEDSLDEAVSLSQVPCLLRNKCLWVAWLIVIGLEAEASLPPQLLALDRGRGRLLQASLWKMDSFLRVWGLSSKVQNP